MINLIFSGSRFASFYQIFNILNITNKQTKMFINVKPETSENPKFRNLAALSPCRIRKKTFVIYLWCTKKFTLMIFDHRHSTTFFSDLLWQWSQVVVNLPPFFYFAYLGVKRIREYVQHKLTHGPEQLESSWTITFNNTHLYQNINNNNC